MAKPKSAKEAASEEPKTDAVSENPKGTIAQFIIDKAVLIIVLGAFGYFLGYRFLFTYYGSFGLDSAFFQFSTVDVVSAGWRTFILIVITAIFGYYLFSVIDPLTSKKLSTSNGKIVIVFFLLFFIVTIGLLITVSILLYFKWNTYLLQGFFIWSVGAILSCWLMFIIGNALYKFRKNNSRPSSFKIFKILFPSPYIWFSIIILALFVEAMFISSYNGALYAERDKGELTTLQSVSITVNGELNIPNGQKIKDNVWQYDQLRLLVKTEDILFVFRPSENLSDSIVRLYGIPIDRVINSEFRSWWYKINTP